MNTTYDAHALEILKNKIERMQKDRHIQALNILVKYQQVTVNEPKYGNVNINLSCVPKEAIEDLVKFVSYVEDQESSLMLAEEQKKIDQEVFFAGEQDGTTNSTVSAGAPM